MLKYILLFLFIFLSQIDVFSQSSFYAVDSVREIRIYFYDEDWDSKLDDLYIQGDNGRILADLFIDGFSYDSVGVRYKGFSSVSINRVKNPIIVVGYDRRFLAPEFAEAISAAIGDCELEPLLTNTPVPTPACSWAVVKHNALGALIVTASHNPSEWIGLKIKGPMGGSVDNDFTKAVENRISLRGAKFFSSPKITHFQVVACQIGKCESALWFWD